MRPLIYSALIITSLITISACGGKKNKARAHAEEVCSCLQDIGFNRSLNILKASNPEFQREFARKAQIELPKKLLKIFREMESDLNSLGEKEKKEYMRTFMKASLDTECADVVLDNIPYSMIGFAVDQMEREIEQMNDIESDREELENELDQLEDLF